MKAIVYAGALMTATLAAETWAACGLLDGLRLGDPITLQAYLNNHTLCATAASGTDKWASEHPVSGASGNFYEAAQGTNPVDPRHVAGTWSIEGTIAPYKTCYDYGTGGKYCYYLYVNILTPLSDDGKLCNADTDQVTANFLRKANAAPSNGSPCFP